MSEPFSEKISFVLKVLCMSRARLAADLGVDKSVVGRWITGAVKPSAHNLAHLSALLARKIPGFTALDWDRDFESFSALFGVEPRGASPPRSAPNAPPPPMAGGRGGLPLPFLPQAVTMTAQWGGAYEGFYRSTRPHAQVPGQFIHDHVFVRRDAQGLLRLSLTNSGVFVDGWILLLKEKLFVIGSEFTTGILTFAIINGLRCERADRLDGIILSPIHDEGQTPTATAIVLDRIADLTGDAAGDDALFTSLASADPRADAAAIPAEVRAHLLRDIGPEALAAGGDLLLRMPLSRSLTTGIPLRTPGTLAAG